MTTKRKALHAQPSKPNRAPWWIAGGTVAALGLGGWAVAANTGGEDVPNPDGTGVALPSATAPRVSGTSSAPTPTPEASTGSTTSSTSRPEVTTSASPTPEKRLDPNTDARRLIAARYTACGLDFVSVNGGRTLQLTLNVESSPDSAAARGNRAQNGPISWSDPKVVAVHLGANGQPDGTHVYAKRNPGGDTNPTSDADLTLHTPSKPGDIYGIYVQTSATSTFEGDATTTTSAIRCGVVTDGTGSWRPAPEIPEMLPPVVIQDHPAQS
jgi:hypothetical protein